jgi:hypothetical protein
MVVRLRRGGGRASCGKCGSIFKAEGATGKKWRYVAQRVGRMAREQLANYWLQTHKGDVPAPLRIANPLGRPEE